MRNYYGILRYWKNTSKEATLLPLQEARYASVRRSPRRWKVRGVCQCDLVKKLQGLRIASSIGTYRFSLEWWVEGRPGKSNAISWNLIYPCKSVTSSDFPSWKFKPSHIWKINWYPAMHIDWKICTLEEHLSSVRALVSSTSIGSRSVVTYVILLQGRHVSAPGVNHIRISSHRATLPKVQTSSFADWRRKSC